MSIYNKHYYTNKHIDYLCNNEIIEYDMKSAGLSIISSKMLLPSNIIDELKSLPKNIRVVKLGNLQKNNKELVKSLNDGFCEYRKRFIEANNITDNDIISIKKDALFVLKRCQFTKFDDVEFSVKNKYTSYLYFDNGVEIYYGKNKIDVKGINEERLSKHSGYMLDFFKNLFMLMESSSKERVIKFLNGFMFNYKTRNLDVGYYREFNNTSMIRLNERLMNNDVCTDNHMGISVDDVDIKYNYFTYFIKIVQNLI